MFLVLAMKKHWISLIESPDDVTEVGAYEMARLDCAVQGADNPQIYWYKDGQPLNMVSKNILHGTIDI